jgi:hypothetical protein
MMAAYVSGGATTLPLPPTSHRPNSPSPLQRFVKGKRKINDIFVEIEDYVIDSTNYINGMLFYIILVFIVFDKIYVLILRRTVQKEQLILNI